MVVGIKIHLQFQPQILTGLKATYRPIQPVVFVSHCTKDTIHILLLHQLYTQNTEKASNKIPSI